LHTCTPLANVGIVSDVTARLGFNTLGLGSALTAQGFKNLKPEP
jgi:hypothetical protein